MSILDKNLNKVSEATGLISCFSLCAPNRTLTWNVVFGSCLLDARRILQEISDMRTYSERTAFLLWVSMDEANDDNEDPMVCNMPLHRMD